MRCKGGGNQLVTETRGEVQEKTPWQPMHGCLYAFLLVSILAHVALALGWTRVYLSELPATIKRATRYGMRVQQTTPTVPPTPTPIAPQPP